MKNNQALQYVRDTWILEGKLILEQLKSFFPAQRSLSWFIPPLFLSFYANRTSTTFDSYLFNSYIFSAKGLITP